VIYQALIDAAHRRLTTAPKLARLLLITILSDRLIDAVLDAPTEQQSQADREEAQTVSAIGERARLPPPPQASAPISSLIAVECRRAPGDHWRSRRP